MANMESLPDDLLFDILVRVPAQDIYYKVRCVCRKWYHMIHTRKFINAHFHHTIYGLLINDQYTVPILMTMQRGQIEITKFNSSRKRLIWTSCNGLILEYDDENPYALYIVNPAINQRLALPLFSDESAIHHRCQHGVAYVAISMEYKVVIMYDSYMYDWNLRCVILTVGVDSSWRDVNIEHLSLKAKFACKVSSPLITGGYMHWAGEGSLVTLNVETEQITDSPLPQVDRETNIHQYYYLSSGRYVSLLIGCRKFSWKVWEMKPENGEWTKLPNIDLEDQKLEFIWLEKFGYKRDFRLVPVGWLKYPEVLVFSVSATTRACIVYNVHTQEINLFELTSDIKNLNFIVHRNSLVWLD